MMILTWRPLVWEVSVQVHADTRTSGIDTTVLSPQTCSLSTYDVIIDIIPDQRQDMRMKISLSTIKYLIRLQKRFFHQHVRPFLLCRPLAFWCSSTILEGKYDFRYEKGIFHVVIFHMNMCCLYLPLMQCSHIIID